MTITATELARVRVWVPDTWEPTAEFDDDAVEAVWDREADVTVLPTAAEQANQSWANIYVVAYELTERMASGLAGEPDSFSVGGEYSESRGAAVNLLLSRLKELRALRDQALAWLGGTGVVTAVPIVRVNYGGR